MSKLIKVNPSDYGLEEKKAQQIEMAFKPMLKRMTELEKEYNEVVKLPIDNMTTVVLAKELRLKYVKVRTGTVAIHKEMKAFYLAGGRFVDGWKSAQLFASHGIESKLSEIENYFINIEKERIEKLQSERSEEVSKYDVEYIPTDLGKMADEVWKNYISGVKLNYEAQKEAERKAESERIAKEKAEIAERKRIAAENERLKKEAQETERTAQIESDKREKAEAERVAKEEAERKVREEKAKKEREEYEAKLSAECEEKERIQRDAKEKADKLEAELKAKEDAERKAEQERLAAIESDLNKGDAEKVKDLINDLEELKTKYIFKSNKNKKMYASVGELIVKVVNYINN